MQKPPCQDSIYLKIKAKFDVLYFSLRIEKICMGHPKKTFTFYWYYFWVHYSSVKSTIQIQQYSLILNKLSKRVVFFQFFFRNVALECSHLALNFSKLIDLSNL